MQQFEVIRALDELKYVKQRLKRLADALPIAQRRGAAEMGLIIDNAIRATIAACEDEHLSFPEDYFDDGPKSA